MNGQITKERFEEMGIKLQLGVIFDTLSTIDKKINALQKSKKYDKALSTLGGIIGGIIAFSVSIFSKIM